MKKTIEERKENAKKDDGTIRRLKDNWILGVTAEKKTPRGSIIRNVLGLVE